MVQWLKKNRIQNVLFSGVWCLFLLAGFFWMTEWYIFDETGTCETIWWILEYIVVIVCTIIIILNFICKIYSWKIILAYGITGIIVLLSTWFSKDYTYIPVFLLFGAAYKQNSKRVITISAVLTAGFLLLMLICSQTGLAPNEVFAREKETGYYWRQSLGLAFASTAPSIFLGFILQYIYLRKQNMRIWEFIILEVINAFYFFATDSRMPFYLGTATLIFFCIEKQYMNHWRFIKHLKWLAIVSPGLFGGVAVGMTFLYKLNIPVFLSLDNILSNRLHFGAKAIDTYGIKLFGQEISWIGLGSGAPEGDYNFVDCSYLQILVQFGIMLLAAVVFLYIVWAYRAAKEGDYWMVCIMLIICVYAMIEPYLLSLVYIPLPILAVLSHTTDAESVKFCKGWLKNAIKAE